MEIWIKVFVKREQSYGDLEQSLRPAGTKLRRSKCSPSGIQVMEIWIKVFVQMEQSLGDLEQSFRPARTKLRRSKCSPSGM